MINLLPLVAKKEIAAERLSRLIIFVGGLYLIFLTAGVLLMLPSLIALTFEEREIQKQRDILLNDPAFRRIENISERIRLLNDLAALFRKNSEGIKFVGEAIDDIFFRIPAQISITGIVYNPSGSRDNMLHFRIEGVAKGRNDLLLLRTRIEEAERVQNVDLPIAYLLKDKDIDFALTFDLAPLK